MVAYEFSIQVTDDEVVLIPRKYARKLQKGAPVRVILLVDEHVKTEEETLLTPDEQSSLEEVVARIQRMGPNPHNITLGGGKLAEKLAHPLTEPDPAFDLEAWTREWDRVETEMKAQSLAHEEAQCLI